MGGREREERNNEMREQKKNNENDKIFVREQIKNDNSPLFVRGESKQWIANEQHKNFAPKKFFAISAKK